MSKDVFEVNEEIEVVAGGSTVYPARVVALLKDRPEFVVAVFTANGREYAQEVSINTTYGTYARKKPLLRYKNVYKNGVVDAYWRSLEVAKKSAESSPVAFRLVAQLANGQYTKVRVSF